MKYPHTITLFNKYVSNDESISYFKTKIRGVLFVLDEVSSVKSTGDIGNDRVLSLPNCLDKRLYIR